MLNLICQVFKENIEIFHLATIDIYAPSFYKTSLLHKINCMASKGTLPYTCVSCEPQKALLRMFSEKILYQILTYLSIPNHIIHGWRFVPKNRLLFFKGGSSTLKTAKVMAIGLIMSLAQEHDEFLCLNLPMVQIYHKFGLFKALTNLRSLFPHFCIKGLCEG